jgi:hypothetical protein
MSSVYAFIIARILNIEFLNGMIQNAPLRLKFLGKAYVRAKLTFPFSDLVLSNSYAGLRSYKSPPHKSYCIHNGFDFSRINDV